MEEMKYPLISVIVPVYNDERYLKRCLDSLLAQTYPNLEIILVNDGSTDNSLNICEDYARVYLNINVINKPNGGISSARNAGLVTARGQYVGFVDSDDWVSTDMYLTLYNLIKDNKADAAQVGTIKSSSYKLVESNSNAFNVVNGSNNILKEYLFSTNGKHGWGYSVCRCLFQTNIAKKIKFEEGKQCEDICYKYLMLKECNKYVVSEKKCYYYFQSGDSISTGLLKKSGFDLKDAMSQLLDMAKLENDDEILLQAKIKVARVPFSLLCRAAYYGIDPTIENRAGIIKSLMRQHRGNVKLLLKSSLPNNRKIVSVLLAVNFNMVKAFMRIFKKLV